jgi:pimeloyl-ACP methyl ester carboxylesterase
VTPEQQADDVRRLLSVLGGEPAHVFGSSGGAVVGLARQLPLRWAPKARG